MSASYSSNLASKLWRRMVQLPRAGDKSHLMLSRLYTLPPPPQQPDVSRYVSHWPTLLRKRCVGYQCSRTPLEREGERGRERERERECVCVCVCVCVRVRARAFVCIAELGAECCCYSCASPSYSRG
ncbi:hypothetical protein LZ32DRAFT_152252 [Colletotrichum eremochloae]|nr:hypothetical protein LZ32DRAFT_152252 [Colletotrichum eremochloae]